MIKKFFKNKKVKSFGIDKDLNEKKKLEYDVKSLGYNYRMTDFQAALGFLQLKRYKKNLLVRKQIAKKYNKLLSKTKNIKFQNIQKIILISYFLYYVEIEIV